MQNAKTAARCSASECWCGVEARCFAFDPKVRSEVATEAAILFGDRESTRANLLATDSRELQQQQLLVVCSSSRYCAGLRISWTRSFSLSLFVFMIGLFSLSLLAAATYVGRTRTCAICRNHEAIVRVLGIRRPPSSSFNLSRRSPSSSSNVAVVNTYEYRGTSVDDGE